jgi:hypothetical protein
MPELTLKAIESLLAEKLTGLATQKDLEHLTAKVEDLPSFHDITVIVAPLKTTLASIEAKVDRISVRTAEEHAAVVKDAERLTGRVQTLEKQVGKLKPQPAA